MPPFDEFLESPLPNGPEVTTTTTEDFDTKINEVMKMLSKVNTTEEQMTPKNSRDT